MEFLNDITFLQELDKLKVRVSYAKLVLLNFQEEPIREIQGTITSGSISVNGSSAVRRTINLSLLAKLIENDLTDINNEISVDKKVKIEIGLKNPLKDYKHYGDIVWFPCGVYVISTASSSRSTSGWNISLTGKDKMCLLDGSCGGLLPATTVFDSTYDENGVNVKVPIIQIIREAVNHLGNEKLENIIINDLPEKSKKQLTYRGDNALWFNSNYTDFRYKPEEEEENVDFSKNDYPNEISYGMELGYKEIETYYPDELVLNAGEPITNLLKKITDKLGNYEYFYDLQGRFIFQEKQNYLNTQSPLRELQEVNYLRSYSNLKALHSFNDLSTISQININPKYENIKNDFIVWGTRETASGAEVGVRYRLVIDEKPKLDLAKQYMWAIYPDDPNKYKIEEGQIENYINFDRYYFTSEDIEPKDLKTSIGDTAIALKRGNSCNEWREELYRQALVARAKGQKYSVYDEEMVAEWRKLFDTLNTEWEKAWEEKFEGSEWTGWNPDVETNPEKLDYWLDFIDTSSSLGRYSVNQIGRRGKIVPNSGAKTLYNSNVPQILFIFRSDYNDDPSFDQAINSYANQGQAVYPVYQNSIEEYLFDSPSYMSASCFDYVRELLYQHLSYNVTTTITCLPKYYLEPNQLIYLNDIESNTIGHFAISQFTLPLTYNGAMSLTLTEALKRI